MAAKLTRLVVGLLAAGSLGIAAPAQAQVPPCVGHTDYVVVCVFPLECYVLGDSRCNVTVVDECFGDPSVVAVCIDPVRCYAFGGSCSDRGTSEG